MRAEHDYAYFAREVLDVTLHAAQIEWLENSIKRQNVLAAGNRWGKSYVSAVKILHQSLYRQSRARCNAAEDFHIITASLTQNQANIIFDQVVRLANASALFGPAVKRLIRRPYPKLVFATGATIEARSTQNRGQYLLGCSCDLFIFDEVAFHPHAEYVVEQVVQMRLADRDGRLDLVSTPNGANWFSRHAGRIRDGRIEGYFQRGDSRDNPFISGDFLGDRMRYFSEFAVQQNIMGKFISDGREILLAEHIDRALATYEDAVEKGNVPPPTDSRQRRFITGWDLARKRTATVGITIEIVDNVARVVCLERFRQYDWSIIFAKIKERQERYPGSLIIDATGLGDVVAQQLALYKPTSFIFTEGSKAELLTNLEIAHAKQEICYGRNELPDGVGRIWSLEDELRSAKWDDNSDCDALMALALSIWPLRRKPAKVLPPCVAKVRF